ncbi:light-regulated signal transduction histidine kinase (bacteriophytochrome) [Sphingomonas insulae]|uniref:Phytochrome chromophore attachment site domain-containing protein n=1 Tax=Sphingomonas insulae TaxID=424800 RepID=A0ABN1HWT2_9SPHN|nr:histidine kinase dimerization/phosphoacceptor domain -containing protein [Sphingomonas insulae]NIJ29984.1 light-regulated signal transduction histidine kinase (bacteriophytochrome) [Sphingomonas insulae]
MAIPLTTDPTLDLTACDREPIHIPGAIQPHGLLLIAEADGEHRVIAGAGDLEARLAPDWLGSPLAALVGQDVDAALRTTTGPAAVTPLSVAGIEERFVATLHRAGDRLLVELEPMVDEPRTATAMLAWLDGAATTFERAADKQTLYDRAAVAFRTLTGFDRVMIYRFLDDDAGSVVAEDRDPALGSFRNHHFPASDIPKQARALYIRNRTRTIPRIDYTPAPLRPAGFVDCDLSDVALRHVSPIHLQYLRNMGVGASASISIVKDGLLWGLVACHHNTPRLLPPDVRSAAATLASGLARQIRAKEEAAAYRERLALRAAEDSVVPRLNSEEPLRQAVVAVKDELCAMLDADGFAMVAGDQVESVGRCPDASTLIAIARWVRSRGSDPVATHELSTLLPEAGRHLGLASGLLALPLYEENATLLWLRAETVETIEWAGNPHKSVQLTPGETLTPRASFASFSETVRGRSRRWTQEEVEAAHRLRRRFHEARQNLQVRILNRELNRTLAEKDALLAQKDVLMKEVNHRVQNSLQLVASFLRLQAKAAGGIVADQLAEAQARLAAVALVHRRLYRDDQVESVDLSRYIDELVADMRVSLGDEWGRHIRLDLAPILVPTDRAVNIGLILTELVINATKYAYPGGSGPIAIALEQHSAKLRLIVADDGRGKGNGEGFGSRMMEAMVQRLNGDIEFGDNHPGLRAIMTAPIAES